jgi:mevalonate kinase
MTFLIPGKTFLVGEYIALEQGPSLIFCSKPYFKVSFKISDAPAFSGLHPESPAGKFLKKTFKHGSNKWVGACNFKNPYKPPGGLGASSAEFLAAYKLWLQKEQRPLRLPELLKDYRALFKEERQAPSGADLIAQAVGGLVSQIPSQDKIHTQAWPFKALSLLLVHTNKKLATHEHLKCLRALPRLNELTASAEQTLLALENNLADLFIQSIADYGQALKNQKLVAPHTLEILNVLKKRPDVLACKGCGAMGADVLAIICERHQKASLIEFCKRQALSVLASDESLSEPSLDLKL